MRAVFVLELKPSASPASASLVDVFGGLLVTAMLSLIGFGIVGAVARVERRVFAAPCGSEGRRSSLAVLILGSSGRFKVGLFEWYRCRSA